MASRALLVARTDPDVPKHEGLTYFALDMNAAGRRGPAAAADHRRGGVQRGLHDRRQDPRRRPDRRGRPGLGGVHGHADERAGLHRRQRDAPRGRHDRIGGPDLAGAPGAAHARACTTGCCGCGPTPRWPGWPGSRLRQQLAAGQPGPEGSAAKLVFARLNQDISEFEVELAGADGLRLRRLVHAPAAGRELLRPRIRATGSCGPRATRSRAARPRSCATSWPSACSGCRRKPGGHRTPMEGPAPVTAGDRGNGESAGRAGRERPRPPGRGVRTCCTAKPRPSCAAPSGRCWRTRQPGGTCWPGPRPPVDLRHRAVADARRRGRLRRPADPRVDGRRRRRLPGGRRRGRGARPVRRAGARSSAARWWRPRRCSAPVARGAARQAGQRRGHGGAGRPVRCRAWRAAAGDRPARRARSAATRTAPTGSAARWLAWPTRCPPTCCWSRPTACRSDCTRSTRASRAWARRRWYRWT